MNSYKSCAKLQAAKVRLGYEDKPSSSQKVDYVTDFPLHFLPVLGAHILSKVDYPIKVSAGDRHKENSFCCAI